jgi:hypothetical protein
LKGYPGFFASVASKESSFGVSLLDATLAGRSVNVADKELTDRLNVQTFESLNVKMAEGVYPPPFLHEHENRWVAKCTPVSV